jgi:hypothetical protein
VTSLLEEESETSEILTTTAESTWCNSKLPISLKMSDVHTEVKSTHGWMLSTNSSTLLFNQFDLMLPTFSSQDYLALEDIWCNITGLVTEMPLMLTMLTTKSPTFTEIPPTKPDGRESITVSLTNLELSLNSVKSLPTPIGV